MTYKYKQVSCIILFYKFKYKKFNYRDESQDDSSRDWVLYPLALKRCNYFIESDMTPEKFEKLWNEIPRRENEKL